jgi:hypothetical protein
VTNAHEPSPPFRQPRARAAEGDGVTVNGAGDALMLAPSTVSHGAACSASASALRLALTIEARDGQMTSRRASPSGSAAA